MRLKLRADGGWRHEGESHSYEEVGAGSCCPNGNGCNFDDMEQEAESYTDAEGCRAQCDASSSCTGYDTDNSTCRRRAGGVPLGSSAAKAVEESSARCFKKGDMKIGTLIARTSGEYSKGTLVVAALPGAKLSPLSMRDAFAPLAERDQGVPAMFFATTEAHTHRVDSVHATRYTEARCPDGCVTLRVYRGALAAASSPCLRTVKEPSLLLWVEHASNTYHHINDDLVYVHNAVAKLAQGLHTGLPLGRARVAIYVAILNKNIAMTSLDDWQLRDMLQTYTPMPLRNLWHVTEPTWDLQQRPQGGGRGGDCSDSYFITNSYREYSF